MDDGQVLRQIQSYVEEERDLLQRASKEGLAGEAHARLKSLEVGLDQCWDLLRQRRALQNAGEDPDQAHVRDATTVEHYQQ